MTVRGETREALPCRIPGAPLFLEKEPVAGVFPSFYAVFGFMIVCRIRLHGLLLEQRSALVCVYGGNYLLPFGRSVRQRRRGKDVIGEVFSVVEELSEPRTLILSMTFLSSLTLPGQGWRLRRSSNRTEISERSFPSRDILRK